MGKIYPFKVLEEQIYFNDPQGLADRIPLTPGVPKKDLQGRHSFSLISTTFTGHSVMVKLNSDQGLTPLFTV